jgi:hypothetical protein
MIAGPLFKSKQLTAGQSGHPRLQLRDRGYLKNVDARDKPGQEGFE